MINKRKKLHKASYENAKTRLLLAFQPLPEYESLHLPEWMTPDIFGELLYVYQFFRSFSELLPMKEVSL